jgi:ketosteroid isomerase-like protein
MLLTRTTLKLLTACLCLAAPVSASAQSDDDALLELNRALFETQLLDQDPSLLRSVSDDSYVVIAPGGVVETRDQVIRGLRAFAGVDSITIENERVVRHGATAVVVNRLVIHGALRGPVGQPGPVSAMTVFHRGEDGEWRVVSRALTRCDPRAVDRGIC